MQLNLRASMNSVVKQGEGFPILRLSTMGEGFGNSMSGDMPVNETIDIYRVSIYFFIFKILTNTKLRL